MKKCLYSLLGLASLLVLHPSLQGQATSTASRSSRIQAGVGGMYLNNDFSVHSNQGLALWGDFDLNRFVGVEAEVLLGGLISQDDINMTTYQIGPRLSYHRGKFTYYGKFLFGRGIIGSQLPKHETSSTYNIHEFGGGFEYQISRHFNIRALDAGFQKWPDFEPHTLSPFAISAGVMYTIR